MFPHFQMLRTGNCLMTSVAVFIGGLLVFGWNFTPNVMYPILLAMIAAFLISGAGNVINDIADFEADKINRPKRQLPSGKISRRSALVFMSILFVTGNLLALSINWLTFFIAMINSLMLVAYSVTLQHKVYVGNVAISYLVGSSFIFGGAALNQISLPLVMAGMAFFANMAREITKDLEDIEGDKFNFIRKIKNRLKKKITKVAERFHMKDGKPVLTYDPRVATFLAILSLLLSIAISPLPYLLGTLKLSYLIVVSIADFIMISSVVQLLTSSTRKSYAKTSKMIKLGMFLGLLSFIIGVLI